MAINKPILPPKAGYIERVDSKGNHYYAPTPETLDKLNQEKNLKTFNDVMNILLGVKE